jgi:hypothetical protein
VLSEWTNQTKNKKLSKVTDPLARNLLSQILHRYGPSFLHLTLLLSIYFEIIYCRSLFLSSSKSPHPFQLNSMLIFAPCFLLSETPHVDQRYPGSSPILFYRPRRSPDLQGKNHDDMNRESRCRDFLYSSVLTLLSPFSSLITSPTHISPHSSLSPLSSLFLSLPLIHKSHPIPHSPLSSFPPSHISSHREHAAYDVFLSYRVNSDAHHAEKLYNMLTERYVRTHILDHAPALYVVHCFFIA